MTDLESVVEDGQMTLRKKRPLWRTPTRTAALAVLDEIRNFEKSKVVIALIQGERKIVVYKDCKVWYMCGTNMDTQHNEV